ncbi:PREDICTED: CLAVATA3/ESR (CLE)-related protein 19 [Populus euphratica]|uniref:CLAVATA3/ESR (CLE)-related protein 19 n=1 Tax=Populus euphratica TaxID=75702 RepID=A0AAJ6XGI7_POPEU|nr:PREDICTED: CLAVATA3/ESR (CLE)-related protein 19 [Populus euphratica]
MRVLAVLVMALSLLIFGSIGRSDAVPKTTFLSPVDGSNKKKSSSNMSSSSSSLEAVNTLFSNSSKIKNITLDEMRVVPTGPNPLHNRSRASAYTRPNLGKYMYT